MAVFPGSDLAGAVKFVYGGCTKDSGAPSLATAAGTADNVAIVSATIDRMGYDSACILVTALSALTAAQTLSVTIAFEDSADDSSWDASEELQAATVLLTGAGNKSGVIELGHNLAACKRYVRYTVTPNLSHSGTDTAIVTFGVLLGGATNLPAA